MNREQGLPKRILEHSHYSFPQRFNYRLKLVAPSREKKHALFLRPVFGTHPLLLTWLANQHGEAFNQDSLTPIGQ